MSACALIAYTLCPIFSLSLASCSIGQCPVVMNYGQGLRNIAQHDVVVMETYKMAYPWIMLSKKEASALLRNVDFPGIL